MSGLTFNGTACQLSILEGDGRREKALDASTIAAYIHVSILTGLDRARVVLPSVRNGAVVASS